MSERPKSASVVVPLLIAATVLGVGFGGGVLYGWGTRKHTTTASNKSAESMTYADVKYEIAACKRELKALKKVQAKAQVTAIVEGMDDAGMETVSKVEALQKEVQECRVRETIENAYVCGTIGDNQSLYGVLVHGNLCADAPWIEEYVVNSLNKCAEFDEFPAHLEGEKLSKSESPRIYQSLLYHDHQSKKNLVDGMGWTRRECRRIWALPAE